MNKENINPKIKKLTPNFNNNFYQNKLITSFFKPLQERNKNFLSFKIKEKKLNLNKIENKIHVETIKNFNEENFNYFIPKNEINFILNEFMSESKSISPKFLNQKRKFNTIQSEFNKNFINYKLKSKKKILINNNQNKNSNKKNKPSKSIKISILTYNILNQIFMKKINRSDLSIENRMNKIILEILSLKPDIFCLQEADLFIYKEYFLNNIFFNEYSFNYGINCGSSFINIIGFKKEKFTFKSLKNFSLISLGKEAGNRGIINIQLECNLNKKVLSVYNIHLPWKFESDRIILLKMIFEHILENSEIKNVFITGDFNSEPNSNVIKMFYLNKFLEEIKNSNDFNIENFIDIKMLQKLEKIKNIFYFQSAYQSYSKFKQIENEYMKHPKFTSRTKFFKRTIDYIFFSKKFKIIKIYKLPNEKDVEEEKFLPNQKFPSDHLKLFAEFIF